MKQPKFSIVAVHNRHRLLRATVESLVHECVWGGEVIVVDDASTDGSLDAVAGLDVRTIRREKKGGVSAARNEGLREARGRYVAFFDGGDLLVPGAVIERAEYLEENPDALAVGGVLGGEIDENGSLLDHPSPLPPGTPLTPEFFRDGDHYGCEPSLYLFRTETLRNMGGFDPTLTTASGSDLLLRVARLHPVAVIPVPVLWHRRAVGGAESPPFFLSPPGGFGSVKPIP